MTALELFAAASLASLGGFCAVTARIAASRAPATPDGPPTRRVTVSIVRPCEGAEPGLADALRAPDAPALGDVEVLACTGHPDDPAAAVARSVNVTVVVDAPETASWTNPKARHLEAGLRRAKGEVVVFADADAEVDGPLLERLVAALLAPGVTGAFTPPMAAAGPSWGNRLLRAALGGSLYAWPALVALTRALGQDLPMSGALVAFRREDLPEGMAGAAHAIGDDLALAAALQRRGRLVMIDRPVVCARGAISFASAVATLRRWVHVAALDAPWRIAGFPFLFSATWLLVALLPTTLLLPLPVAAGTASLLLVALVARVCAAHVIRRRLLGERVRLLDLVVVEAVLLDAALRAAVAVVGGRELAWRDRRYRVGRGGRILSVRRAGA